MSINTEPSPISVRMGTQRGFHWLTSTNHTLHDFLHLCPYAVIGKYLAITSLDSGPLRVNEELRSVGWESRNGIGYSVQVRSVEKLPHEKFDEWYVFESPADLGQVSYGNVFEPSQLSEVNVFVNYCGFVLDSEDASMRPLIDLFWKQLESINPESYLGDGSDCLNFASRNQELFAAVCRVLAGS